MLNRRQLLAGAAGLSAAALTGVSAFAAPKKPRDCVPPKFLRCGNPTASPTPTMSGTLPFDMPDRSTLAAATKKVFAHYFVPFPISVDNEVPSGTEYIQQYWMPPGGNEFGTDHNVYGGRQRDRKPTGPRPLAGDFEVLDRATDIRNAIAAGFDGFLVDILQLNPLQRWTQLIETIDAAAVVNDPYFKLVMMPDSDVGDTANNLADNLASIANEPSIYWHDDAGTSKLMIAPFNPESATPGPAATYWSTVMSRLSGTHGIQSLLWPCYVSSWTAAAQAPAFNSIAYGHSRWGDRDPTATGSSTNDNRNAPSYCHTTYSKPWMHFASPQDSRPNQSRAWEAGGSDNLRASWSAAIDGGAEWVQVPTWDDFSENTQVCPTEDSGWGWTDLTSYYSTWFKMGAAPPIVRDCVYLIHRPQPYDTAGSVTITGGQTSFIGAVDGATAYRDEIEALAFLTAPADIEILANGTLIGSAQSCSAGITAVKRALTSGTITARIVRGGSTVDSVTSPTPVSTTQVSEDLLYRCVSSLRS